MTAWCAQCGHDVAQHLREAAAKVASRYRVPTARVHELLVRWWEKSILWAWDSEHLGERKMRDLRLIIATLHVLASNGLPDEASSPTLQVGVQVPVEIAARVVRPASRVEVPRHMWKAWACPQFDRAGRNAPVQPHSNCLKAAAMVQALLKEGLMEEAQPGDEPDTQVFVKHKSDTKAALVTNLVAFNHTCAHKARKFKLPSLEGLCGVLREVGGGARATKLDLQKCYWSIVLPPQLQRAIHVGVQGTTVAVVRVPFGWHQAPGLVQHLVASAIAKVPVGMVVVVQYLDDILFLGRDKQEVARVTGRVAN